jgi:hypothetical protein
VAHIDRGSSKHGPRLDDEMRKEVEGQVRAGHPTRVEEWHDPEPPTDEQDEAERRRPRPGYPSNVVVSEN